jgi:hypothetical protein
MNGIFLLNDEGKLCYVRPAQADRPQIKSFRYEKKTHRAFVTSISETEEEIDVEIMPEMRAAFQSEKDILIADLDKDRNSEREYRVPLSA